MGFDVDYFIEKIEKISEDSWFKKDSNIECSIGYCLSRKTNRRRCSSIEHGDLKKLFSENLGCFLGEVNDNVISRYNQETPKQRILSALVDVKNKRSHL